MTTPTPAEKIASQIIELRGRKVILSAELASLYGVSTKRLNEQVKRNQERFPDDFAFRLTKQEQDSLRSQIATSKGRGGDRYLPWAFTEHGAIQAANGLRGRIGVGGWRFDDAAKGAIDAALCTLSLSGRADRPRSAVQRSWLVDPLAGGPGERE